MTHPFLIVCGAVAAVILLLITASMFGVSRRAVEAEIRRAEEQRGAGRRSAASRATPTSPPDGGIPYPDPPLADGVVLLRRWERADVACAREGKGRGHRAARRPGSRPSGAAAATARACRSRSPRPIRARRWAASAASRGRSRGRPPPAIPTASSSSPRRARSASATGCSSAPAAAAWRHAPSRCSHAGRSPRPGWRGSRRSSSPTTLRRCGWSSGPASCARGACAHISGPEPDGRPRRRIRLLAARGRSDILTR